jgi:drug/metabolite transporter (DMT)-like permease
MSRLLTAWGEDAVRGALWMTAASVMIALSAACVRQLSGQFSPFELVFLRSLIGTLLLSPWMFRMSRRGTLRTTRLPLYMLRTGLSYTGMVCVFYGIGHMPIGEVYALLFLVPLITVVLAVLLLREHAGAHAWIACTVGFCGALVILRPGIIELSLAAGAVMVTAVTYASTNICIKSLSRTDSPVQITIIGYFLALPLAFVPTPFVWKTPGWEDVPWILALGAFQTLGGLCHARSVHAADARVVQPFNFLRLPVSVLVAWFLFAELPSPWTWLGAALIFASSYYVLYRESAARRKKAQGT